MRIEHNRQTPLGPVSAPSSRQLEKRELSILTALPDSIELSRTDLDREGHVHVIVYSDSNRNLDQVRHLLQKEMHHAGIDRDLPIVNGFSAHLEPKSLPRLMAHLPEGVSVHKNNLLYPPSGSDLLKDSTPSAAPGPPPPAVDGVDPSRAVIGMPKVWAQGFTGKGIGVAIIDSGIYPHPDLKNKITGWVDIADGKTEPYDKFGHGTHVAGDVAGSGKLSEGRFRGIAPDANLIGVRITTVAEAIKALQWCIDNKERYNIRVVNMSLGDFATRSYKDDPWSQAAEKAIQAGIVVVVAAGNEGPDPGTVSTPGIDPRVITVGAVDDKHTVDRRDDGMAGFSSRGPTSTDGTPKPDVIAPGVAIYSTLAPGTTLDVPELPHVGKDYIAISGTSMATPIVAGLVATMLEANPQLTHDDVKKILTASADRYLPDGINVQGYGLVDGPEAIQMALAMKDGSPAPQPPTLPAETMLASASQPATAGSAGAAKPRATAIAAANDGFLLSGRA